MSTDAYTVWMAPSSVKLWADTAPLEWQGPLHMARNDVALFHVALSAQQALTLPSLTASSPTLTVKIWQEAPLAITTPSHGLTRSGRVLDALLPPEAQALRQQYASVPAGETRAWLVEVASSPATPPGRHAISLSLGGRSWQMDVNVYDVTLSNLPTLKTEFATGDIDWNAAAAQAHGLSTNVLLSPDRYRLFVAYHDDMARQQLAPYSVQWPSVFNGGGGENTMLAIYYDCQQDRIAWPRPILDLLDHHLLGDYPVADTMLFYFGEYRYGVAARFMLCGLNQDDPGFEPAAEKFFAAVARDLRARGYLDRISFFVDEPTPSLRRTASWWEPLPFAEQSPSAQRVVRAASAAQKAGIRSSVAMYYSHMIEYWTNPALNRGYRPFNRWIFLTDGVRETNPQHPNNYAPLLDPYVQAGDEKWVYWVDSPSLQMDGDALDQLLPGLMAYRYDVSGLLTWASLIMNPNPWRTPLTSFGNGATNLYYPPCGENNCTSPTWYFVPSLRLKLLSEGVRFHQYLKLLEQRRGRNAAASAALLDALILEPGRYHYDWRLYEQARRQVLEALVDDTAPTPNPLTPTPTTTPTPTPTPTPASGIAYTIPYGAAAIDANLDEYAPDTGAITFGSVEAKARWDEDSLYIGARVTDADIIAPRVCGTGGPCDLWAYDALEFFVDPRNNGGGEGNFDLPWMEPDDIQIIVSAGGEMIDLRGTQNKTATLTWNGHARYVARTTNGGYIIEISIPWTDLGISPRRQSPGDVIGLGLAWDDRDITGKTEIQWQRKGRSFQNAASWPRVILNSGFATPTPTPTPTETASPTPTETLSPTPTETASPTPTETPSPTPTETASPTPTPSPTSTPTSSPTSTPPPLWDGDAVQLEAETGELTAEIQIGADAAASGARYIYTTGTGSGASATLTFDIPHTATYSLWVRGMGLAADQNTIAFSLDDGALVPLDFLLAPQPPTWQWRPLHPELATASIFTLTAGRHTLTLYAFEPEAGVDTVLITSDPDKIPGAITGTAFIDVDANGRRDPNERLGLSGLVITLQDIASPWQQHTITDASGHFTFHDAPPRVYELQAFNPPGFAIPTSPTRQTVALPRFYDSATAIDFGFATPASVRIASFTVTADPDGAQLRWTAYGPAAISHYTIWRAPASDGPYKQINDPLALEDSPDGAEHSWLDRGAFPPEAFWYKLRIEEQDETFGPISAGSSNLPPASPLLFTPLILHP